MGPEDLSHRVTQPSQLATLATPKVSWVLMEDHREDSLGHVIADDEVGVRRPEVLGVSLNALSEGAVAVVKLTNTREYRSERDGPPVERILGRNSELLARR